MSKKEKKAKGIALQEDIKLDIPEEEIWTYQVPGLAAPHINKPYKHYNFKKAIFVIVIIISVTLSMLFSVLALQNETFEYTETENGLQFSKFSNTGYLYELEIDYASDIEYIPGNNDPATNFKVVKDESKPITSVRQFTLNCDDKIKTIYIGPDVLDIDGKAFYSCWALQNIEVDENNPNYCDVDGVLYNKDKTEILCYPCDHDEYLRQKYGYERELYRDEVTPEYERDIQTYVVPSTVKKLGEMCFNYANLRYIYLPEGLKFIGSDAFSYNQALEYVYIPSSVTHIGHHAFWDTCYKEDGGLKGVTVANVAVSADDFASLEIGDDWIPKYDYLLFKKAIDVNYSAERQPMP